MENLTKSMVILQQEAFDLETKVVKNKMEPIEIPKINDLIRQPK
jgi:hypothetical protein